VAGVWQGRRALANATDTGTPSISAPDAAWHWQFSLALALTAPPTASNGTPLPRPPASFRGPSSELLRVCESASLRVCESASLRRCAFRGSLVGGEQPPAMSETLKAAQALHVPALTSTTRPVTDAARQPLLLSSWPPHTAPLDIPTPHSPLLSSRWEVEVNTRRRLLLFLVPNLQHPESLSLPALPCSARQCPSLQTLLATTHSPAGSSNSSNSSSTSVTVPIHSPPSAVHLRHGWPQLPQSSAHPFRPPKAAARVGRHAPPSQSARHTFSTSWQAGSPSLHRSSRVSDALGRLRAFETPTAHQVVIRAHLCADPAYSLGGRRYSPTPSRGGGCL